MIAGVVASQLTAILSVIPNNDSYVGSMQPYTTQNYSITKGGVLYLQITSDEGDGVEVEYFINNSYVGYIYVTGSGYVASQSISVSDGDVIKFRLGAYGYQFLGLTLKDTNSSGIILFTGNYETA